MNNSGSHQGIHYYFNDLQKNNVVVLIHGNSLNATTFGKQLNTIKHIPMLAIDLPGHGLSAKATNPESAYCLPGYINAVKKVIQHLGIESMLLAGHSLGGHIAIEAMDELQGVRGLMIFGTPPIGIPPQMERMFYPNPAMAHLFSPDVSQENARLVAMEFVHDNLTLVERYTNMICATDGNARANLGASIAKGQFKNEKEIIANTKIPTAIVNGEKDALINKDYMNELSVGNLWNNKVWMDNAGHLIQEEKPEEFNKLLIDFYNSVF